MQLFVELIYQEELNQNNLEKSLAIKSKFL